MRFSIVVVGIKHSGNLGAIARVCDNFDVERLILVAPQCEVDDIAYERATHARKFLDDIIIVEHLKEVHPLVDSLIALSARAGGRTSIFRSSIPIPLVHLRFQNINGHIGIVLGREDTGLTNDEVSYCDFLSYIPLPGNNKVFNISHAAAVALWSLHGTLNENQIDNSNKAISEDSDTIEDEIHRIMKLPEKTAFLNLLDQVLSHSWVPIDKYNGVIRTYKSIFGRAFLTQREANALIGTLRGILRSMIEGHPPWDNCGVYEN